MRRAVAFILLPAPVICAAAIGESACSDANQIPTGGQPLFDAHVGQVDTDGAITCLDAGAPDLTWASLYQDFFGPTGIAQCGDSTRTGVNGTTSCHHDGTGNGALASGFICGDTQESCYEGITAPAANFVGVPVVAPCAPDNSYLTQVLRRDGGGIMPFYPESVVFSDADMARIRGWISNGAPND